MGSIISRLWNDPDYFSKSAAFAIALLASLLPVLPLGELGPVGYWLGKLALPIAVAVGATARGSGLTPDEAAKLRALIPVQEVLDKKAPKV